jgi:hypothetical protein
VWYHDHAIGITRLNAYAGIASAYIIRDDFETSLVKNHIIPAYEVLLVIQDKTFVSQAEVDKGYFWGNRASFGIRINTRKRAILMGVGTTDRRLDSERRIPCPMFPPFPNFSRTRPSSMELSIHICRWSSVTTVSAF